MPNHATPKARNYGLAELALYSAAVALVLALLGELTYAPRGYNIENFLGWTHTDAIKAMRCHWEAHLGPLGFGWVPRAYLAIDTAVFMPLYGLLLLGTGHVFADIFNEHARVRGRYAWLIVRTQLPALIVLLLLVDGIENTLGLWRLGVPYLVPLLLCTAVAVGWGLCRRRHPNEASTSATAGRRQLLVDLRSDAAVITLELLIFALVMIGVMHLISVHMPAATRCSADWPGLGCHAHTLKQILIGVITFDLAVLGLWPLLLPHAHASQWAAAVTFRRAMRDVVFRSRYVLVAIAVVILLLLGMNQGRDVIYAIAASPWDAQHWSWRAFTNSAVVMLLTSASLWTFGYACWLWARLNGMTRSASAAPRTATDLRIEWFARDWARGLGIAPSVIAVLMCLAAVRDAVAVPQGGPIWGLAVFVIVLVGGGIGFVWNRTRDDTPAAVGSGYYDSLLIKNVLKIEHYTLFGLIKPLPLASCTLAAGLLCRALQVLSADWQLGLPSLALPVFIFEMTFWLCLAGWLSLYEQSESVPAGIAVIIVIGVLGVFGLTDNHIVAGALGVQPASQALAAHWMLCLSVLMALLVAACSYWLMRALRDCKAGHGLRAACLPLLALLLGGRAILALGDCLSRDNSPPTAASAAPANARMTLPDAMSKWLSSLMPPITAGGNARDDSPLPVYFIAAEGGGIRSAYWTASVLARLYRADEAMSAHTFAYSGVSGGSVGLAVFRGCSLDRSEATHGARADALDKCVAQFGRSDLLTPLLGAWFFEDGVARLLPQHCQQPGCGFLSRGLWFERALEEGTPALRSGLLASRTHLTASTAPHVPYLLLNSTWVETGERTIASDLAIDWQHFPAARDQLDYLGVPDLRLATAAHNSARFPFTNALGSVRIPHARCTPPPLTPASMAPGADDERLEICGHLADGGYFDNSGARTLSDVLRVFSGCLGGDEAACPGLGPQQHKDQLKRLRPVVLLIRNGVERGADQRTVCSEPAQPHAPDLALDTGGASPTSIGRPRCAGTVRLFADTLGPLITALNTTGIGANGRVAAATPGMSPIPLVAPGHAEVIPIDLYDDGPLFPLGWHLSVAARAEMDRRSKAFVDAHFGAPKQRRER